eukprot:jgi/Mesvir1/20377/Mv12285-RA.2
MPTVSVGRDLLFKALGKTYTEEEFDELCFEYGIELDDVTTEKNVALRNAGQATEETLEGDDEILYKIDVPANRYDLLCLEGLARALRIFQGLDPVPNYRFVDPPGGAAPLKMTVMPETAMIRPFVVCAVMRNLYFTPDNYQSFIDLQDRLHQNICRRRTLVAIGTHDLDTLAPPFTYEALPPKDIKFVPLKQTKEFNAEELMEFYQSDNKLKKFLHIINDSPVFPVLYDSKRTVLSLPPIINGAHSAITLKTTNVFIECTATDLSRAHIVLDTVVTMFSQYCSDQFTCERVEVAYADGSTTLTPQLSLHKMVVDPAYVTNLVGVTMETDKVCRLLSRMALTSREVEVDGKKAIEVSVPPTRSDVLHACDVAEDLAIAYGYNNVTRTVPKTVTVGRQLPLNHFSDLLRAEVALAGFSEVLTWVLGSHVDSFENLRVPDDGATAVVVGNPKGLDFELVRPFLLSGILKTMGSNKEAPLPVKLFEVGDVVRLDVSADVGARNRRHLSALCCAMMGGFEVIHGLLDRVMEMVGVKLVDPSKGEDPKDGYHIKLAQEPMFFPGRQAQVVVRGQVIGHFGLVHPEVGC